MTEQGLSPRLNEVTQFASDAAHQMLGDRVDQTDQEPHNEILNKEDWHQQVEIEVAEAQKNGDPLTVLLMDLDGFKAVNDELGHEVGDEVINEMKLLLHELIEDLGLEIQVGVGETDDAVLPEIDAKNPELAQKPIDGHIGGDEFAILCHCDKEGAEIIKSLVKERFAEFLKLPENAHLQNLRLGVAVGIGELSSDGTKSDLLMQADEEMYEDKIKNLPDISDERKKILRAMKFMLDELNRDISNPKERIRLRDLPKYFQSLNLID